MNPTCSRRRFLQKTVTTAATLSLAPTLTGFAQSRQNESARVAVVRCAGYGAEVGKALKQSFDLLGGIGSLVNGKTVTIKLNLTGTNFTNFLNRSVGETYMTH